MSPTQNKDEPPTSTSQFNAIYANVVTAVSMAVQMGLVAHVAIKALIE